MHSPSDSLSIPNVPQPILDHFAQLFGLLDNAANVVPSPSGLSPLIVLRQSFILLYQVESLDLDSTGRGNEVFCSLLSGYC
ncbi:unnamed protein product [Periconia digitata]|uniref:Uncharacterized protein n=1 Tax=Periconia digitata TaxID=1303443 RepID=A0A9W4U5Q4_9PLEO|nr:unnamed protein product [Periconia digitata]